MMRTADMAPAYSGPCFVCGEHVYEYEGAEPGQCYYCGHINCAGHFVETPREGGAS